MKPLPWPVCTREKEFLEGTLPAIRCRMFVLRNNEQEMAFQELKNQADTLTLFPDSEIGALTFRGVTHTCDEECAGYPGPAYRVRTFGSASRVCRVLSKDYRGKLWNRLLHRQRAGAMPEELHAAPVDEAANDAQESDVSLEPEMEIWSSSWRKSKPTTREHLKKIGVSQERGRGFARPALIRKQPSCIRSIGRESHLEENRRPAGKSAGAWRMRWKRRHATCCKKAERREEEIDTMLAQQMEKEMPDLAREYAPYLEDPKSSGRNKGTSYRDAQRLC